MRSSVGARLALALLALSVGSGCLRLRFERSSVDRPPPPAGFEFLGLPGVDQPGPARGAVEQSEIAAGASLETCLEQLGAPMFVWARDLTGEQGFAAAWGWRRVSGWGIVFSIPLGDAPSANLDYSESDRNLQGLVLFFDAEWRLERADRAFLADVLPNVGLVGSFAN
jgi:hypothetical protein